MKKSQYIFKSFLNAAGVLAYIIAVALLLSNGEKLFGDEKSFFIPVFMLTLLVFSASITGLLVLGRPIHLYFSGFKKEALTLLFSTLAWIALFVFISALILVF